MTSNLEIKNNCRKLEMKYEVQVIINYLKYKTD